MALTATFVDQVKHTNASGGGKYRDGDGMYLLVNAAGKYWSVDYRFANKRKTLALGVYPEVSLPKARKRREAARELLADGIDPSTAKREAKQFTAAAAANTFEAVAREWLSKTAAKRMGSTQGKVTTWLEKDVFPFIGRYPITTVGPRDVLATVRKLEARGAVDSAHRVKQICGQVFRFAVADGKADRDVTTDLRGALATVPEAHFAAITEPKEAGGLMRTSAPTRGTPAQLPR